METKLCTKCNTDLPVDSFILVGVRKDGRYRYTTQCRSCRNLINSEYMSKRRQNPEFVQKEKEYLKQYCEKNRKEVWEIYNSKPKSRAEYNEEEMKKKAEELEDSKTQYRETHKEQIKEKHKIYHESNKEMIAERKKKYRENNKDKISEQQKIYYEKNKDIINVKRRENEKYSESSNKYNSVLIMCDCGREYRRDCLSRHKKSSLHTKRLNNKLEYVQ
jgi:hypothetical protein